MSKRWMLYGANGYTGELTARLAKKRGMTPVLAGRSEEKIRPLAEELGFEYRVFSLDDTAALEDALSNVEAILLDAGPFSQTSAPVVDACIATHTHYLDITGEIGVFEAVFARAKEAEEAGVCLMPGVGFDVIPTDCMAVQLKEALPSASHLELAIHSKGGMSRGTTKTSIEALGGPGVERVDGKIAKVPLGQRMRHVRFPKKARDAVSIPWGDIASAYRSTGIKNIRTYMVLPKNSVRFMRLSAQLGPLFGNPLVRGALSSLVERTMTGPDADARARGYTEVWGEVFDLEGNRVTGTLETPEGYSFTADASLCAVARMLDDPRPGACTAAMAWGWRFIEDMEGVTVHPHERLEPGEGAVGG